MIYAKDLILSIDFEELFKNIVDLYYSNLDMDIAYLKYLKESPSHTKEGFIDRVRNNYITAINEIKKITPSYDDNSVIVVEKYFEYDSDEDKIEDDWTVCFCTVNSNIRYSLMGTAWEDFLGMPVINKSINDYGTVIVAAHILWELTYMGYTPETTKEETEKLAERLHSISDSGKTYSLEEVEEHLADVCCESAEERKDFLSRLHIKDTEYCHSMNQKAIEMSNKINEEYEKAIELYFKKTKEN